MTLVHITCPSCAAHPERNRPHEVLTDSPNEIGLFRMAHTAHGNLNQVVVG